MVGERRVVPRGLGMTHEQKVMALTIGVVPIHVSSVAGPFHAGEAMWRPESSG